MTRISTVPNVEPDSTRSQKPPITRGVRRTVLENGLTIITRELHAHPVVAAMLWYRVGSRNEELGQTGKSHFLEHMLFKGTDRFKRGDIDLITVRNGGSNNAFTWLDFTAYYFVFASDRWDAALEIEANRIRNTSFAEHEFHHEKQVVEEELRIGLDGPWEALDNEVWASAFREHPYHWPTVGWLRDLESATADDMKAYYDTWYHPRNAVLVILGDFETQPVLEKVAALFGPLPAGPVVRRFDIVEPPQRGEKRLLVKKATPVERLLIGYHAVPVAHPDSYPLHVAETILSTGKTSRLYRRLIEKDQSVTLADASFHDHIDAPLFYVRAELKPGYQLQGVEQAIYQEIGRLASGDVAEAELAKAIRQIEADLILSNEEPLEQALLLGQYETIATGPHVPEDSRGYKYLDTMMDRVRAVTIEDVARVSAGYLSEDNRTVGYLISGEPATVRLALERPQPADQEGQSEEHRETMAAAVPDRSDKAAVPPLARADQAATRPAAPAVQVEMSLLENGLTLLVSEDHSISSVAVHAAVQAGSRYEDDARAGLASLVVELLDEGTSTRSADEISEAIESVGARLATGADYEMGHVKAAMLSRDFPSLIEIISDVLINPSFPEDKVKLYVARRTAQIKSRLDQPRTRASDVFNELVFSGTPQHRPPIGYEATVAGLTRDRISEFHKRYYVPNNTVLAIVGDIDAAEVKKRVEQSLGGWKRASDFIAPKVPRPARQTRPTERFVTAQKEQVNILLGHLGVERKNPDYYALLVMDTILGSTPGFTSRIPRVLRDEQGLAYSTFSNITASAGIDPGRFVAYIGTSPENLAKALDGLRREIYLIVTAGVTQAEVDMARDYLTGHFVFDFQTNSQIAEFLITAQTYGLGFDYLQKYPERIRAITAGEVDRVARKYLAPDCLTTVVVGPVDENGRVAQ
jgi:zinc protease